MKRTAMILFLLAACGGSKKSEPAKPEAEARTAPEESATPTEGEKPAEKAEKPAEAPAESKPDSGALAAAALTEQYELGKKVYAEKGCAKCHGEDGAGNPKNPPVIGEKALPEKAPKTAKLRKGVAFKTAKDVMGFVKAKMPLKSPGTLSDDEAAAVTAWMLSESKVKVDEKLTADNADSVKLR
jgi:cytochrome c